MKDKKVAKGRGDEGDSTNRAAAQGVNNPSTEDQRLICEICAIFFEKYADIERHFGEVHEVDGASMAVAVNKGFVF